METAKWLLDMIRQLDDQLVEEEAAQSEELREDLPDESDNEPEDDDPEGRTLLRRGIPKRFW